MASATALPAHIDLSVLSQEEQDELLFLLDEQESDALLSEEERAFKEERQALEADLAHFAKSAWPILEPGVELEWSWHYDVICEYLTAVYLRIIKRLIINISPRTGKSLFVSVIFPAWVWAKQNTHNFACASYSAELSTEHSVKRRSLIESEWYQARWGDKVRMARDQNQKTKFKNTAMAQMLATSVGGTGTGLGGDTLILDDGMNPKQVGSDAQTLTAHDWFDKTWKRRLNNPATGAFIIMEQRTGERDITGFCLEKDDLLEEGGHEREWVHLKIPLVCENVPQTYNYPISGKKHIREVGDVLQPTRFPPSVVASLQVTRLIYATQYQQEPSPLEGNIIKVDDIQYYGGYAPGKDAIPDRDLPEKFDVTLITADCAFKDLATSDFVAVAAIGVLGPDKFVLEVTFKHLDLPATEKEILRMKAKHRASTVLVEDKANGPAVIKSIRKKVAGVVAIEPEGGKFARMMASCGEFQSHNWYFDRNAAWTQETVHQLTKFPQAKYDDVADAITQARGWIAKRVFEYGYTEYLKRLDEEMKKKAKEKIEASKPARTTKKAAEPKAPKEAAEPIQQVEDTAAAFKDVQSEDVVIGKIDRVAGLVKPDVDDMTDRCPSCQSPATQQRIAGGRRCSQCGHQYGQPTMAAPGPGARGMFTK